MTSRVIRRRVAASTAALLLGALPALAQDAWDPFKQLDTAAPSRRAPRPPSEPMAADKPLLAPMDGASDWRGARPAPGAAGDGGGAAGPIRPGSSREAIVREDLDAPPGMAAPAPAPGVTAGGLPTPAGADGVPASDMWRGLDLKTVEELIGKLDVPPRSPAVHALWRRLLTADAAPPAGGSAEAFAAVRADALFRSGLGPESAVVAAKLPAKATGIIAFLRARSEVAAGNSDRGCEAVRAIGSPGALNPSMRSEAILLSGYCAAVGGNAAAAGLAADMAREAGEGSSAGVAALDAIGNGGKPPALVARKLSLAELRLMEQAGGVSAKAPPDEAAPIVLAVLAQSKAAEAGLRLVAAEAAVRLNAISPEMLADAYRAAPGGEGDSIRRAQLFKAAEAERTPLKKVRAIRTFLDDARRGGIYLPALVVSARAAAELAPVAEIGWFAETAVEIALAAGDIERARTWARFAAQVDRGQSASEQGAAGHWLALADIAEHRPSKERDMAIAPLESLALRGRLNADLLHRLATVLDALDYQVPIPLWEAASRTPQPNSGHLPEAGVLTSLQDAAKKKEFGRTVLLTIQSLGPNGAEGAHMIALGDSIRALKRAGLEADARRLAFEALFASWPRQASN